MRSKILITVTEKNTVFWGVAHCVMWLKFTSLLKRSCIVQPRRWKQ